MNIGERIKGLREERGWTPFDLSLKSGVREQTIRAWEAGRRLPSDLLMLAAVATALDTTVDGLMGMAPAPAQAAANG